MPVQSFALPAVAGSAAGMGTLVGIGGGGAVGDSKTAAVGAMGGLVGAVVAAGRLVGAVVAAGFCVADTVGASVATGFWIAVGPVGCGVNKGVAMAVAGSFVAV